jgi:hypothetical protein
LCAQLLLPLIDFNRLGCSKTMKVKPGKLQADVSLVITCGVVQKSQQTCQLGRQFQNPIVEKLKEEASALAAASSAATWPHHVDVVCGWCTTHGWFL